MKRCPECHQSFEDGQKFCDIDGVSLIDETVFLREALIQSTGRNGAIGAFATVLIGVLVGVALSLLVYVTLLGPLRQTKIAGQGDRGAIGQATGSKSNQMVLASSTESRPAPSLEAPTPEPTEEQQQTAASPAPAATTPPQRASLNDGPISTGGRHASESVHPVIKMKDGSTVEAEAAWEDSQGVWYRRSGLVSFVERSRVEKIIEAVQPPAAEAPKP